MCARELNSEVATTGPCAEEAYWWARCRINGDTDVSTDQSLKEYLIVFPDASKHEDHLCQCVLW